MNQTNWIGLTPGLHVEVIYEKPPGFPATAGANSLEIHVVFAKAVPID
jgi:hypothetical protein